MHLTGCGRMPSLTGRSVTGTAPLTIAWRRTQPAGTSAPGPSARMATRSWLRQVPAVETLRRVWVQQFYLSAEGVQWRTAEHGIPPSSLFLSSPYDTDAHLSRKRTTKWFGYKAHLTETCDEGRPHLITLAQTMATPVADAEATTPAHTALRGKGLLPAVHLVDTRYLDAELLVATRRDFGIDLAGPARADERWQAREGKGFAEADFSVDWEQKKATCPQGAVSTSWTPALDNRGTEMIKVKFSGSDRGTCQHLADCTRGARARRSLTLRRHEQHIALMGARRRETMAEFAALSKDKAFEVPHADGTGCLTGIRQQYRKCGRAKTVEDHRQRHLTQGRRQLPRTVAGGTQAELVKVDALLPHRDLNDAVQLTQRAGARHQQAPPHHWTDPEQPDLDLYNPGSGRVGRRRGRSNERFRWLWGLRHPASLRRLSLPARAPQTS